MEKMLTTQQALNKLRLQALDSPVLPIVTPLFDTLDYRDDYYPNRVSESDGYTQLLWKTGEQRNSNFEQVCLTLSRATLSMTIALANIRNSSSMIIDADHHVLHETNRINGVLLGTHYDHEAISRFKPKLAHSLAAIGLYGYGQDMQREVS